MNLISGLIKIFYWPVCRAYARHLGDMPADRLFRGLCSLQYWRTYKCWPNFLQPNRFTEKVWSRQLHARDPILTKISDKYRVRDYVATKVGRDYLVPLLWNGEKPEEIPFDELPVKYVIKANHGCGFNIIVSDKSTVKKVEVIRQLKKWMNMNFGADTYLGIAWAYKNIKPHIIIESFLGENEKPPEDYKFFCFSGHMEYFKIDYDRFEEHSAMYFDKELNGLGSIEDGFKKYSGKIDLPANFVDMVRVAELLGEGFDFIRVDLYNIGGKIYFGELTPYPGGIFHRFNPDSYDYIFGEKWKINYNN